MILLKIIGGLILLIFGILVLRYQSKNPVKDEHGFSELVKSSINFEGYLLAIILILTGIGLIISVFV